MFNQGKPFSWNCYKWVPWETKKLTIKEKLFTMLMDKNQELYNYIKKIQKIFQNSEKKYH